MKRSDMIRRIEENSSWDVIVIGGGASGLGAAVDSASRGWKTLLLEQYDFAKGTSSRSTKLIHGGLRYLQQANLALVKEALQERGILCRNAPHLVHPLPFIVPHYHWWESPFYRLGLKVYDWLAGRQNLAPSHHISKGETLEAIPSLKSSQLQGGILYYDAQFDDARLAITLAKTLASLEGVPINYMKVTGLIKKHNLCQGVIAADQETGQEYSLYGQVIINATGAFADTILRMDDPGSSDLILPSQGIHLTLPKRFLPNHSALLIPRTSDNRVLFLIPWHDKVLLGTTDTPISRIEIEPRPKVEEIDFLLTHAQKYLQTAPLQSDILSVFAGIRPLIRNQKHCSTASLSREHLISTSPSGLITAAGGKWTTYRKMGEDLINQAIAIGKLPLRPCKTQTLPLYGHALVHDVYGSERIHLENITQHNPSYAQSIHPRLPYSLCEVVWAARQEMACKVEDVLARRTRSLFLDARASIEAAPLVAALLAQELQKSPSWEKKEIESYRELAQHYLP